MSTQDLHLLAGAYVLDALDADDRAEFEAHLEVCADCVAEVAEFRETAARLATLTAQDPPPSLRENVLARIASTSQLSPEGSPEEVNTEPDLDATNVVTGPWSWARQFAVAAVVLGILALSMGTWALDQRDVAAQLSARSDVIDSVLTAPDATITVKVIGDARASLLASKASRKAVLVATGLPVPANGQVYALWRIDDSGRAASAGTHVPGNGGELAVPIEGSLAGTKVVAMTIEPAGGSEQPTSAPLAAFTLA